MVRSMLAGAAAGALSGLLVLGLAGRLAMSVTALAAGHRLRWSLGGTVEVVVFGLLVGAAAGAPYGMVRSRLPRASPLTGVAWGALAFALLLLVPPPAALSAFGGVRHVGFALVLALFGAVFLAYGLLLEWLLRRAETAQLINATRPTFTST